MFDQRTGRASSPSIIILAEREGFEPPIGLHLCRISSAVHSTTLPPLLKAPRLGAAAPVVGGVNRRGWRARQGAGDENQTRFLPRTPRCRGGGGADCRFRRHFEPIRPGPFAHGAARGLRPRRDRRITGLVEERGVGPPDAVNTGGPVPLIETLARKGGFAGQARRRFDPSARAAARNAIRSLT